MFPDTSPPIVCASGMFMYVAASAVAIVSKRSPTVITTSGWSRSNAVGSSSRPRPVDFAIVLGVSPSISMNTRSSRSKPSLLDQVDDAAVAVEQRGRADDELQLEVGVRRRSRASPT